MSSLLKKYGVPLDYEDGLPVIPDIKPPPNYGVGAVLTGRYEVKSMLNGAAGDVYHCFDMRRKVDVALKTIIGKAKTDRLALASFYREIERRLLLPTHPNVITLKRIEDIDGYYFIVSEWVAGGESCGNSMTEWFECHSFTLEEIVNFMQQMCAGLTHCHTHLSSLGEESRPYVFGDLKPDNILIDSQHILKLADFSGGYTPGWNAPEQAANSTVMPDVRTDIFCLGKIASAMLSRIDGESTFRDAVSGLLEKCLHPKMERRISNLAELNRELLVICENYSCVAYVEQQSTADTFMDYYNRLASKLNFGHNVSVHQSLSNQAYAHGYLRGKFLSLDDFKEYTAGDDRLIHQAMAYSLQGDLDKALETLRYDTLGYSESAQLLYRRATLLYAAGKPDEALHNLDAAILKDFFLPACDFKANLLLDHPNYAAAYLPETGVMLHKLSLLPKERSVGYLLNQVIAKYEMLAKRYEYAASYFRRALQYANFNDEWLTLYYYAACEFQLKNTAHAAKICDQAIRQIEHDPQYLQNAKQCITLLFCNSLVGNTSEMRCLAAHIKSAFGLDYFAMLNIPLNVDQKNEQD